MSIVWTIVIGFFAGVVAKLVTPGDNHPRGFIITTILGVLGAVVATWVGQEIGWYGEGEAAGFLGAIVGSVVVLSVWGAVRRA
ncbi:MAG: GlsB/YeaQ/YmgE family stress response membrane protein [Aliihoeflea sp.]